MKDNNNFMIFNKMKEKYNQIKLNKKQLYLITNSDDFESEDKFLDAIASAIHGGVDILLFREKNETDKEILELGKKVKQLCLQFDTTFIVNDRIDIALLLESDGIHLGQDDIDIHSAKELLGDNAIIGFSAHTPEQALNAVNEGVDYITLGPVFKISSKTTVGLDYIKWASKNITIPAFAIGGINLENANHVLDCGINKIAVSRAVLSPHNPRKTAENFIKLMKNKL